MRSALVVLLMFCALGVIGPQISRHDPYRADIQRLALPPSADHWLGTDHLGRDLWSRWAHGARNTLLLLLGAGGISVVGGLAVGVAFSTQHSSSTILRGLLYGWLSLPPVVIALLVVAPLPRGTAAIALAAGVAQLPALANVIAAETRRILQEDYCTASRALGAGWLHIARHCVGRNLQPLLRAVLPMMLAYSLLTASTLSFLGLAERPDFAEWGALLAESRFYFQEAPLGSLLPGFSLFALIFCLHRVAVNDE